MCMEDHLYGKLLNKPLCEKPEKMDDDEWNELDMHVLGVIRPCLSKNVIVNVSKDTTTKGLMKTLSNLYEKPSTNKKVLEEKEVEKEVPTAFSRKANAKDGVCSSVPSKLHSLDHVSAPESQPKHPFADMPPLEEFGTDEEEITVVERNTSATSQKVETPGPRRTERVSKPTQSYDEAIQCDDSIKWKLAMNEEMKSLRSNMTWDLVKPPSGHKKILQNK
ncbi:hypothetical protein LIER_23706 [Lithospermum erythrorhizon]|uniref:Uncharacterized protein n=1 Tax=Lithospermum erythrorhizon TaxID=34254 RepID=A0AAV3QZQ9_LITER